MFKNFKRIWLIPIVLLILIGLYFIPPIRVRVDNRMDDLRAQIKTLLDPPEQAVFVPAQQTQQDAIATIVQGTMQASAAQTQSALPTQATLEAGPTPIPTITSTPLPASVDLPGVKYVTQRGRWNYCGPANLTMALNFWGWKGNMDDVAKVVKPGSDNLQDDFIERGKADKNVMPYELVDFVNENTEFHALMRYGGDEQLLKRLIAAGYPPIVEKGYYEADYRGKVDWLGHYLFTTGYDDGRGGFIVQDAWLQPGENLLSTYDAYLEGWRSFDYLFMVVYPPEDESKVMALLGPWADEAWAKQHALDISEQEIQELSGNDLFYAWFNKGTSNVIQQQYADAATAYDQAFSIYSGWDQTTQNRPYRMMWYQTGPYFAYYYTGRYQDVINLANTTLDSVSTGPTLEESLFWRGQAEYMIGDTQSAINDYHAALKVHIGWQPAINALSELGLQP